MSRPPTVDVHAHVDVPAIDRLVDGRPGLAVERATLLATFGPESTALNVELARTSYQPFLTTLDARLARMDKSGIDVQAVGIVPTLYHYWADEALAADIVTVANEHIVELVALKPQRLVGLATVSLQHPVLAADQLHRAFGAGLRGVQISTSVAGRDLSDRSLDPFWAAAEQLGAFVFIHPWGCSLGARLATSYLANIVGNPTETTLALTHLVFGAVFDRFPALRVCGAHGGGYFPHYLGRADHAYRVRPESRTMERPPKEYLDRIVVDSLVYEFEILTALVGVMGADHVVLGTDYPFDMGVLDPLERLDALGLSPEDRQSIAGGTAARLLALDTGR